MSSLVKATVLGLGLIAGASFAAQAQTSDNVSALPPGGGNVPSAVAPSGNYIGPNLGGGTNAGGQAHTQEIVPSQAYVGPAPGAGNGHMPAHFDKPAGYDQDRNMDPYAAGQGPKLN
ncbi:MAG TPA: hypothetical protein VFW46_07155 [Stellaceae bacterium]|nr:hypothetical protein [Stellaceae bacterium]